MNYLKSFPTLFIALSLFLTLSINLNAQILRVEPYEFVSASNDTVQAEIGTFNVKENRERIGGDSIQISFIRFKSTNPQNILYNPV